MAKKVYIKETTDFMTCTTTTMINGILLMGVMSSERQ